MDGNGKGMKGGEGGSCNVITNTDELPLGDKFLFAPAAEMPNQLPGLLV